MKGGSGGRRRALPIAFGCVFALWSGGRALACQDSAARAASAPAACEPSFEERVGWREGDGALGGFGGARGALAEKGLSLGGSWIADFGGVLAGGSRRETGFRSTLGLEAQFDLAALAGLAGATLHLDFSWHAGEYVAGAVGDVQGTVWTDTAGVAVPWQAWLRQEIGGGLLSAKVGKIDALFDFDWTEASADFLHNGAFSSTSDAYVPAYPNPAFGAELFVAPAPWLYAGAGVFDGSTATGTTTGNHDLSTAFDDVGDLYAIGEAGATWQFSGGLGGKLGFGAWQHNGEFPTASGGTERGFTGWYALAEQRVLRVDSERADDLRGLSVFARFGRAEKELSTIPESAGGGLLFRGLLPGRDDDGCGAAAYYARVADDPAAGLFGGREIAVETYYRVQATPWFALMGDLQYVFSPGGRGGPDDAFVATLRLELKL